HLRRRRSPDQVPTVAEEAQVREKRLKGASRPRRRLWQAVRIVVTLGLIAFVVFQAGLDDREGRAKFGRILAGVDPFYLVLSFAVSVLMNAVSSWKWHILVASRRLEAGYMRL